MNKEEIISIVKKYVKNECYDDSTGHDWCHIQRVYNNAMLINKKENADEFIITIIVLMHDLYDHKFYNGNIEEKLEEILKELKHRKGMWVCYVRGSTLPTKENKVTCCPEVIHGYGVGKTQNIAHEAAKRYASSRTPKGCTAKHESNNYKCAKW